MTPISPDTASLKGLKQVSSTKGFFFIHFTFYDEMRKWRNEYDNLCLGLKKPSHMEGSSAYLGSNKSPMANIIYLEVTDCVRYV